MGCLYLEIEGQSCLMGSFHQGLMENRQIDLLDRMTEKRARKYILLIVYFNRFFPHSDVTRNLSATNPPKKVGNFLAKLSACHCHRSNRAVG